MGMYTELIFGCLLKKDTPEEIVTTLQELADCKDSFIAEKNGFDCRVFVGSSYYFGVHHGNARVVFDKKTSQWFVSSRANLKNYGSEIQSFLDWIKPYIEQGTGEKDFYAIVTYEEDSEPTIYYLGEEE